MNTNHSTKTGARGRTVFLIPALAVLLALAILTSLAGQVSAQYTIGTAVVITSGPAITDTGPTATFTFYSIPEGEPLVCAVVYFDEMVYNWTSCTSPHTVTGLDGITPYGFLVKPEGYANEYSASFPWVPPAPEIVIDTHPAGTNYSPEHTYTFHSSPADYPLQCATSFSGTIPTNWTSCSGSYTLTGLDGLTPYIFSIKPKGYPGELYSKFYNWAPVAPHIVFNSTPVPVLFDVTEVTIEFSAQEGVEFECALLTASNPPPSQDPLTWDWYSCTSPHTLKNLDYDYYAFSVRPRYLASTYMHISTNWTILPASMPVIDTKPPNPSFLTEASFTFHSNPAYAYQCGLTYEGGPGVVWEDCTSPKTYTSLQYGRRYNFLVKPKISPATSYTSYTWDVLVPAIFIDSGPEGIDYSTSTSFTFHSSADVVHLECILGNENGIVQDWYACTSPQTFSNLTYNLRYGFGVRAKDDSNLYTMVSRQWQVLPPAVVIDSAPPQVSYSPQAGFSFHSDPAGAALECAMNPEGSTVNWYSCTSPQQFNNLTAGTKYKFQVKSVGASADQAAQYIWEVQKYTQSISMPSIASKTYGDAPFTISATATSGLPVSFSASGACTVSGSTVTILSAGKCTITASQTGNDNWYPAASVTDILTIYPKTATITADNKSRAYGESNPALTAAVTGQVAGDTLNFNLSTTATSLSDVGEYPITVTPGSNPNYKLTVTNGTLTVTKRDAAVTAVSDWKYYGDTNPLLTATVVGAVTGGDAIHYSLSTTAEQFSNAYSTFDIVVTLGNNPNYNVAAINGILQVKPARATITANNASRAYGDPDPAFTGTVAGQVPGGDVINYSLYSKVTPLSSVGTYTINISANNNPNYIITTNPGTLTITQRAATIEANDASKTYGSANPEFTATVTNQAPIGDAVQYSFATTAVTCSDTGSYPITVVPGSNPNYTLTVTNATLTVTPKEALVKVDSLVKTYGNDNPALTAQVIGEAASCAAVQYNLSTTADKLSDVGDHPITATLGSNPNYSLTTINGTLTIVPRTATVTADAKSKTYGDENPELTATVAGEVTGGDPIHYSLTTTAEQFSNANSSYDIIVVLGSNPNYNVTGVDAVLTILPATLTVTPDNQTCAYSDPNPAELTFTYEGWIEGEGPVSPYLTEAPTCSTKRTPLSPAGTYSIACEGGSAPNYTFIYQAGAYTVTKESLELAYTGDTQVTTPKAGEEVEILLAVVVEEEQDGSLGATLKELKVKFDVYNFGGELVTSCIVITADVKDGKGYASCTVELGAADPYQVQISLPENLYYKAGTEDAVLMVNDPGTGMVTGGGWLLEPDTGRRASFGIMAKFLKNGRVQGNTMYIYRVTTDLSLILPDAPAGIREYNWIIKSNAMSGLNIYDCPEGEKSGCKATITGKNTIQAVDRETGIIYSLGGNYQFQVDAFDNQVSGEADQYAIRVWSSSGVYYVLGGTYDKNGVLLEPLGISAGNLLVKDK